jgi:hypothetical protein
MMKPPWTFQCGLMLALATLCQPVEVAAQTLPRLYQTPSGEPKCEGVDGYSADFDGRRTFIWRPSSLRQIKTATTREARDIRTQLINRANRAMTRAPTSVVEKTKTPLSGDKHDYYSMGPYWWPDATKPSGEPYVRRDGVVNPERNGDGFDAIRLNKLSEDVSTLALAHFYTGEQRYAVKAAALIRVWFLDPATRMNPNFAYSQAIPGVSVGRAEGIIDGHRLVPIVESIGLIQPSGALSSAENMALEQWFGAMADWMSISPTGQEERAKSNNHGIYYDFLISHFALFARQRQRVVDTITAFPQARIATQFGLDGGLAEELSRTRSWHYSHWTLAATGKLAGLGECVGLDLWRTTTADGRGLARSLSFLARYVARETTWTYPENAFQPGGNIKGAREIALENFRIAGWGYRDPAYDGLANFYAKQVPEADEHAWLAPYVSR